MKIMVMYYNNLREEIFLEYGQLLGIYAQTGNPDHGEIMSTNTSETLWHDLQCNLKHSHLKMQPHVVVCLDLRRILNTGTRPQGNEHNASAQA